MIISGFIVKFYTDMLENHYLAKLKNTEPDKNVEEKILKSWKV